MSQKSSTAELGLSSKNQDQRASGDTGDNHNSDKKILNSTEFCYNNVQNNCKKNEGTSIQIDDNSSNISLFEELENPSLLCTASTSLNGMILESKDCHERSSTHSTNYSVSMSSCSDLLEKFSNSANVVDPTKVLSKTANESIYFTNEKLKSPTMQYGSKQRLNYTIDSNDLMNDSDYTFDSRSYESNISKDYLNKNKKTHQSNYAPNHVNPSDSNKFHSIDGHAKKHGFHNRMSAESAMNKFQQFKNNSSKYNADWNSGYVESPSPTNNISEKYANNKINLIVNYLPPYMSQDEVKALFSSVGQVESCKLVREKSTGESLGYAFVKYTKSSEADKAIRTLNGLRLQNKTIKVSIARPSSESIKGANLYICGLPKKMTQQELEEMFSLCGHIINARILYDNKSGLSRGVAFIRFDQRHEAENAVRRFNGFYISSDKSTEPITVKFANSPNFFTPDSNLGFTLLKQAAASGHRKVSSGSANAMGLLNPFQQISTLSSRLNCSNSPGSAVTDLLPALASAAAAVNPLLAPAVAASSGALTATGWCIFVYNLAPETEEAHLWQLFGPFGAVQIVKIIRDSDSNKCKGFAFVTMSNYEEALLAIHSLNGFCLGDRVLQVSFKTTYNLKMKSFSTNHTMNNSSTETYSVGEQHSMRSNSHIADEYIKHSGDRATFKHSHSSTQQQPTLPLSPSAYQSHYNEYQPTRSLVVQCPNSGVPIELSSENSHNNKSDCPVNQQEEVQYELADSFSGALSIKSTPLNLHSKSSSCHNDDKARTDDK